jgi:hypothetical protein
MSTAVSRPAVSYAGADYGWLRSVTFDYGLILGVTLLALATGAVVTLRPDWFLAILVLDLWLLGYHHVIATFTRFAVDQKTLAQNRFLVVGLPWIVLAVTLGVGIGIGMWAIATVYLYWQWFHYTRQSYGISRAYGRKSGDIDSFDGRLRTWVLYLVPLWGIAWRSYQAPPLFLGSEVFYFPVPYAAVWALSLAAVAATVWWAIRQAIAWQAGRMPLAVNLYLVTHIAVFVVGYVLTANIDHGWLVLNVWHNAQYLLFVWLFNNKQFHQRGETSDSFLATLTRASAFHVACYCGVLLGLTTLVYGALSSLLQLTPLATVPLAAVVLYQTINFHHYVVDSFIWKARKPAPQSAAA